MSDEAAILKEILAWLRLEGVWHRRVPLGPVKHGGIKKRNPLKGMPDILGILPNTEGRMFVIEVKDASKLSEDQKEVKYQLEFEGVLYIEAHSLEDVIPYFKIKTFSSLGKIG